MPPRLARFKLAHAPAPLPVCSITCVFHQEHVCNREPVSTCVSFLACVLCPLPHPPCSTFNIPFSRSASYDDNLAFFKEVLSELHRWDLLVV